MYLLKKNISYIYANADMCVYVCIYIYMYKNVNMHSDMYICKHRYIIVCMYFTPSTRLNLVIKQLGIFKLSGLCQSREPPETWRNLSAFALLQNARAVFPSQGECHS